ncbi:CSC1-like protein [Arachis hypogaea]|nr:CSC1-like protein [Arachis hypogaea]
MILMFVMILKPSSIELFLRFIHFCYYYSLLIFMLIVNYKYSNSKNITCGVQCSSAPWKHALEEHEAHVSDFGTAKFLKPGSYSWTTIAGTFGYAAPGTKCTQEHLPGFRCILEDILDRVLVRNVPPDPDESVSELVEHFFSVNHPDH